MNSPWNTHEGAKGFEAKILKERFKKFFSVKSLTRPNMALKLPPVKYKHLLGLKSHVFAHDKGIKGNKKARQSRLSVVDKGQCQKALLILICQKTRTPLLAEDP